MEPVTVVFLHALPFDGRMWNDLRNVMGARTIAPTLYPLGDSVAEWAEHVLATAGTEPMVVVGCSVGGSCALEVARAAPDQVQAIVLVGAKAGVRPDPNGRDEALRVLTRRGLEQAWQRYWRPRFGRSVAAEVVAEARRWAGDQYLDALARGVRAFHDRRDLSEFASTWTKPLVVVSGDQDRTPSPETARRLVTVTNREFHRVTDSGHYVNLEQPAAFRSILEQILRRVEHPDDAQSSDVRDRASAQVRP